MNSKPMYFMFSLPSHASHWSRRSQKKRSFTRQKIRKSGVIVLMCLLQTTFASKFTRNFLESIQEEIEALKEFEPSQTISDKKVPYRDAPSIFYAAEAELDVSIKEEIQKELAKELEETVNKTFSKFVPSGSDDEKPDFRFFRQQRSQAYRQSTTAIRAKLRERLTKLSEERLWQSCMPPVHFRYSQVQEYIETAKLTQKEKECLTKANITAVSEIMSRELFVLYVRGLDLEPLFSDTQLVEDALGIKNMDDWKLFLKNQESMVEEIVRSIFRPSKLKQQRASKAHNRRCKKSNPKPLHLIGRDEKWYSLIADFAAHECKFLDSLKREYSNIVRKAKCYHGECKAKRIISKADKAFKYDFMSHLSKKCNTMQAEVFEKVNEKFESICEQLKASDAEITASIQKSIDDLKKFVKGSKDHYPNPEYTESVTDVDFLVEKARYQILNPGPPPIPAGMRADDSESSYSSGSSSSSSSSGEEKRGSPKTNKEI